MNHDESRVCAVVVTFHPDEGVVARLRDVGSQVSRVIIVDNTEGGQTSFLDQVSSDPKFDILRNDRNLGPASALNMGIGRGIDLGFQYVLMLDQDSAPQPGMVETLLGTYRHHPERDRIAIVAPQAVDPSVGTRPRFLRRRSRLIYELAPCQNETLEDVSIVIASGSLLPTSVFLALGPFREDFFIDYIDTEFCLRALSQGYRIIVACEARMHHRLGEKRKVMWGPFVLFPTMHAPSRWYYMSRNRIPMLRAYALRFPHWCAFEILLSTYGMIRMLLTEHERKPKFAAFVRGTWHGLRGRMGPKPGSPEEVQGANGQNHVAA